MSKNKTYMIDNILVSGYVREQHQDEVPDVISNIISIYLKEYTIQAIGFELHKSDCTDGLNILNALKHSFYEFNSFLCSQTKGITTIIQEISVPTKIHKQITQTMNHKNDKLIDIRSGSKHTLFLTYKGFVHGVGSNDSGQLALGEEIAFVEQPTSISFTKIIKKLSCGDLHSLFVTANGELLVSGYNYCGQLGMTTDELKSHAVVDFSHQSDLESSESDNNINNFNSGDDIQFIDDSSSSEDWGNELDDCQCIYTPIYHPYFNLSNNILVKDIDCGLLHSLCITTKGECFMFGHNAFGNLGNGQHTDWGTGVNIPHKLELDAKFKSGVCGKNHSVVLTESNDIVVFGNNRSNQCSIIKETQFDSPYILSKEKEFDVPENYWVEKIIINNDHSIVIMDNYKRLITH